MGRVDNVMFSASKKGKQAVTPKQFALLFAPIPSKIRIPAAICEGFFYIFVSGLNFFVYSNKTDQALDVE